MASKILYDIETAFALSKYTKAGRHSLIYGSCGDDKSTNLNEAVTLERKSFKEIS